MRSRTELVTTTFIDSEDDFTETDDSEEDWRPSASNRNVKKRSHTTKGRNRGSRKRKSSGTSSNGTNHKKNRRQAAQDAIYQTFDDSDDEDEEDYEYFKAARTQLAAEVEPKAIILPPKKKEKNLSMNGNTASGIFQLFLYRKDLKEDYVTNSHLCLWRKDGTNLLQKYIRVKTGVPDEFMFTSSSVYSTWDEKRRRDFVTFAVKCHEENHRRVTFVNTNDLHSLARSELERINPGMEDHHVDNDESEEEENDADAEYNSDVSECDENNGLFQPDDDEAEVECDEENIEEIEDEEEQASEEDDPVEEEFDDFEQLEEEDDEIEEIEENDDEDKENQYESDHEQE
ncbi:uncharacterized protein LOC129915993 [Episyrphus balteatus]|uniref:uncharacterized protein LOC129915993 n=1 Tax=Episyrphus balteatus TaxID=286459 RepID=UPI002485796B|nr:uncharacterized protein LOC129915993 [Episyrphus balteatus]